MPKLPDSPEPTERACFLTSLEVEEITPHFAALSLRGQKIFFRRQEDGEVSRNNSWQNEPEAHHYWAQEFARVLIKACRDGLGHLSHERALNRKKKALTMVK